MLELYAGSTAIPTKKLRPRNARLKFSTAYTVRYLFGIGGFSLAEAQNRDFLSCLPREAKTTFFRAFSSL
jgi:hypothetical protein